MSDATRRSLRTGYQTMLALILLLPILLSSTPAGAKGASIIAAVAVVSKVVNALEDAGLIPAWLKDSSVEVIPQSVPEESSQSTEDPHI